MNSIKNIFLVTALCFAQFDWQDSGISIRQGVHIEWQRTADIDDSSGFIFAWSDTRQGGRDIYAQMVTDQGEKEWGENGLLVVGEPGRQEDPILVSDGNGGAYIVWVDYKNEPEDGDIYAQHILYDGTLAWDSEGIPLATMPGKQVSPNMSSDGQGGAYVIWKDLTVSSYGHVYGTHLSNSGALSPGIGIPILSNESYHNNVSIEKGGQGHAVLVWSDDIISDNADVRTQRINQSCETLWSAPEEGGIVLCSEEFNQLYPKVTYYNEDYTVLVWEDHRNSTIDSNDEIIDQSDIYYQFLDINGNSMLADNGNPVCTDGAIQIKPRIKASSLGAFIIWEDSRNFDTDIFSQKVDHLGSIYWNENGIPIVSEEGQQNQCRLTVDGDGGVFYVWLDERDAPYPETDIYIQHIDSNNNFSFQENGLALCDENYYQFAPIIRSSNGEALVLWGDRRTGSIGLYFQHVDPLSGETLEDQGREMFFGIDGNGQSPKSVYLDNQSLLYWDDRRFSPFQNLTYGVKFNDINSLINNQDGVALSQNPYQSDALIVPTESNLFLGFGQTDGDINQFYSLLDFNLTTILSDAAVDENPQSSQEYYSITYNESENLIYYVYSDNRDFANNIYVQQFDLSGNSMWPSAIKIVETLVDGFLPSDDNVIGTVSNLYGGVTILFNSGNFLGTKINAISVNSSGEISDGWTQNGNRLCEYESDQYIESFVSTPYGVLLTFKDNRSLSNDIYAQLISWSGDLMFDPYGWAISDAVNDQESSSMDFSVELNKALVCWEDFRLGTEYDLYCKYISFELMDGDDDYQLSAEIELAGQNNTSGGNQTNPFVYATNHNTFLIAWEDSRNDVYTDIYFQELDDCGNILDDGGSVLCEADFDQLNPGINLHNELSQSYIIYWDDMRSSGKEFLNNIFAQSYTTQGADCSDILPGDINQDNSLDILDIVLIVNHIVGNNLLNDEQIEISDMNNDSYVDILDILIIMNIIIPN